jgi:hypothetical protein
MLNYIMLVMLKFYFQLLFFMIGKVLQIKPVYQPIDITDSSINLDQICIGPHFLYRTFQKWGKIMTYAGPPYIHL